MADDGLSDFPSWALLPKRETNVSNFLNKYPTYDGRGIKIAILDSGVDPGAAGLQKTSDGKVKIIEQIDATGSGDVDTSTVVEATSVINGLSGRSLKIPSSWTNPTKKYHIGLKAAFELYPKPLKERICKEEKEKLWDSHHKQAQANATRELQDYSDHLLSSNQQATLETKLLKEEYESTIEVLNTLEKKLHNNGPVYDCVVFHDGTSWKAVVDTSETGDLESCKLLGTYSETHEYATFTSSDMLNYSVNIHEEGNLLEIVAVSTCHGTHVASIAAACFPDDPEKNGVAPGAQIVSICIGDTRLLTMETGSSITRALIKVIELKCDVINMSYGEPVSWSGGRIMELFHEVINKYGVVMVSSAGNLGPALSTVGAPPTMPSSSIMGIGAYVSPDMMVAEYSLREKTPGLSYTWTSRGPGLDGELNVSVCAPGAAITSVPNYSLRGTQLMNGTSMSSPHSAGCVALLLSGLKSKGIAYSPYSVRRAIENTATKIPSWDAFSMGHGLLQVDKAFDHLVQYSNFIERDVRFDITVGSKKGIYMRESYETNRPQNALVLIEPIFLDNMNTDAQRKISFEMNLKLICDVPWVSVPSHFNLMYFSRNIVVRVDPCGLSPGEHFTWVKAFDTACPEKGPVFVIPVTVIKSITLGESSNWEFKATSCLLRPGKVVRDFINVPHGATYAVFRLRSLDTTNDATVILHALQLRPQLANSTHQFYKMIRIGPKEEMECYFEVQEKRVLELDVVKWWTSSESVAVDYSISFHGIIPNSPNMFMSAGEGIHRIDVTSNLRYETMLPSASLKSYVMVLRPTDSKVSPLRFRDVIPDGRQIYEIQLTYTFTIAKSAEVTPSCPLLSDLLYENEYESQLWMLFDLNKQHIASGDAFPSKYNTKLEKGDYTLKLQVRHEQQQLLEKLSDLPMQIQYKLPSALNLDIYDKHSQALIGGKKVTAKCLSPGATLPLYIAPLASDKLPKNSCAGHHLLGSMTFVKDESAKKINTYPIKYFLTEMQKKTAGKNNVEKEKEKPAEEEFSEALKNLKVSWIPKLDAKGSKELFNSLTTAEPKHVPTILSRIQFLDQSKDRHLFLLEIITLADSVINIIPVKDLLAYFGTKTDRKDTLHKTSEKQKGQLIEALVKKGIALCDHLKQMDKTSLDGAKSEEKGDATSTADKTAPSDGKRDGEERSTEAQYSQKDIDAVYSELQKWTEMHDSKVSTFTKKHAIQSHHYGRALKLLMKQQEEKPSLEVEKECIELYKLLGWKHVVTFSERSLYVKYPLSYRLF